MHIMQNSAITYFRYVLILIAVIIISEYVVMILLAKVDLDISNEAEAIIDSLLLILLAAAPVYFLIIKPIVNTNQRYLAKMESIASLDGLTGIANRRTFDTVLAREWNRAQRNHKPFSLIMVDIDHFKLFNDHYGHQQGDRCLRKVARTLEMVTMRPADVVTRYGGEEFALLLPETELEQATVLAEKCRSMIVDQKITFSEGVNNVVTISLGVSSSIPKLGTSPSELVEAADKALYRAKDSGRNRVISS